MKNQNTSLFSLEGSVRGNGEQRDFKVTFLVTHAMELKEGLRRVTEMPFPLTHPSSCISFSPFVQMNFLHLTIEQISNSLRLKAFQTENISKKASEIFFPVLVKRDPFLSGMPARGSCWPACLFCCEGSPMMGKLRASTKLFISSNYCSCSLTSLYFKLNSYQLMQYRGELKLCDIIPIIKRRLASDAHLFS